MEFTKKEILDLLIVETQNPDLNNSTERVQALVVKRFPLMIGLIDNPSEKVQMAAVTADGPSIGSINKPSGRVQLAAMRQNFLSIDHIKNPTEKVQLISVRKTSLALKNVKSPSEKVQLAYVRTFPKEIGWIKNPTLKVQLLAVACDPEAFDSIKKPSPEVREAAGRGRKLKPMKNWMKQVPRSLREARPEKVAPVWIKKLIEENGNFPTLKEENGNFPTLKRFSALKKSGLRSIDTDYRENAMFLCLHFIPYSEWGQYQDLALMKLFELGVEKNG